MTCGRDLFEGADELGPDDLALRFRIGDVAQRGEELVGRVDDHESDPGGRDVVALDLFAFTFAQQPMVDEDTGELVADRAVHECRRDRGIDPAGETAQHVTVADAVADLGDGVVDDVGGGPRRIDAGAVVQEPLEHRLSVRRCACTSGCHCNPNSRRPGCSKAAISAPSVDAGDREPRAARRPPHRGETSRPVASRVGRRRAPRRARRARWCARTRRPRCASPCRRAPRPSPGSRNRCRSVGTPAANSAASMLGAPSA